MRYLEVIPRSARKVDNLVRKKPLTCRENLSSPKSTKPAPGKEIRVAYYAAPFATI
jgi:hypothetical protein